MANRKKYPWKEWFKKREFTVTRHVDYECQPHSMAVYIRTKATAAGIRVSISIKDDVVHVRRKGQ